MAPQILLEELDLTYDLVWVADEPAVLEAYREINPTGKIPALGLPTGEPIFESAAICLHLTDAKPGNALAPAPGTAAHARYLQWMVFLSANLYDSALRYFYAPRFTAAGLSQAEGVKMQALADFEHHLGLVERALSPFLLGASVSAADIYLFMLAGWHPAGEDKLRAKFPKLGALMQAVGTRPAVVRVVEAQE
jgi:glutathione S-transferase